MKIKCLNKIKKKMETTIPTTIRNPMPPITRQSKENNFDLEFTMMKAILLTS
jgi:hypothetical protein